MKLKLFVVVAAVAMSTASAVLAAPPASHPGKGSKPPVSGANCKPAITVVLHATVAVAPGASPTLPFTLMLTVKAANANGKAFVNATQPVPVTVTSSSKIVNQGRSSLSTLLAGDQVIVQARTCKADLANGATPSLGARMVIDQGTGSTSDADSTTTTTTSS
jgi:hypothetical protein